MQWTLSDFAGTRWTELNLNATFCGPHGDDRNDGHPARPVRTILKAVQLSRAAGQYEFWLGRTYYPVVISSGIYSEALTLELSQIKLIGDGTVILEGAGAPGLTQYVAGFYNLSIQNYVRICSGGDQGFYADKCRIKNVDFLGIYGSTYQTYNLSNCLLQNAPRLFEPGSYGNLTMQSCTCLNSQLNYAQYNIQMVMQYCYFDPLCNIVGPGGAFALSFSNVQGLIQSLSLEDYNASNNNRLSSCINTAPAFNNYAAGDFTLTLSSPMRNLAADGGYVGAYGVGLNFGGQADAQVLSNMAWDAVQGGFVLSNPALKGSVEFTTKDLGRAFVLREPVLGGEEDIVDRETVDAVLSYEIDGSSIAVNTASGALIVGAIYWVNGYDTVTYNGQSYNTDQFFACLAGATTYAAVGTGKVVRLIEAPNIRVFEMKYSLTSAADCNNKAWQYFVYNRLPTIDANGRTNGNPLFSPDSAVPIAARWIKMRATILPASLA
jgi:hypothetical protein